MAKELIAHPFNTRVVFCKTEGEYRKYAAKIDLAKPWDMWISDRADGTTHYFKRGRNAIRVVCIRPGKLEPWYIGLVVHEIRHVVQSLFSDAGEDEPGAETDSYMTQWLVQEALEYFTNKKGP